MLPEMIDIETNEDERKKLQEENVEKVKNAEEQ